MKSSAIPLRYGLILGALLIVYFLILSLVGLHTYVWFSLVNGILTGVGIFMATRDFKAKEGKAFKYQNGFMTGLMTGFYATLIFTIFFAIYTSNINPDFTDELLSIWNMPGETGFGLIILVVATMGAASTFVLTLACMQLFKDSWNTHKPQQQKEVKKPSHESA